MRTPLKSWLPVKDWGIKLPAALLAGVVAVGFFLYFNNRLIRHQAAPFLTFNELKKFSQNPHPGYLLEKKLQRFWRTPLISNEAHYAGTKPSAQTDPQLGPYLSLATWNIEKSIHMKDAITAFSSPEAFLALIDPEKAPEGSDNYKTVLRQRDLLQKSDVILLQEMDIGVKRSGYINAAGELAKVLKMNYAYAPEQLEVDPVYMGLEKIHYDNGSVDQEQTDYFAADPAQYKGAFGVAVLSRYPIRRAQAFQLKTQPYDWYKGEKPKIGFVEQARRVGTEVLFHNQITREMKMGGRAFFRVDLAVPGLPEDTLTIINIHLEIKCLPEGRKAQVAEILSYIKGIKHPVIMAGDFNSAQEDLSPTSALRVAERAIKKPENWASAAVAVLIPQALIINATRLIGKFTKNYQDPLALDIPVIAPNTLKPLFNMIEDYRFEDGGAFDFRGDAERSTGAKEGPLANANQRGIKGFKTTWSVERPVLLLGKYRLDWIFVKSFLKDPYEKTGAYRFAPHFGETLEEMNTSLKIKISDHHPNVVAIPFGEPHIKTVQGTDSMNASLEVPVTGVHPIQAIQGTDSKGAGSPQ